MDPFHTRLAHIALQAAGSYGFALAGGYAVQVHGFLSRMSSDVDLFTTASAEAHFASAVDVVIAAYRHEGIHVDTDMRTASFARLNVTFSGENAKVELGVDWRKEERIQMAIGPVLHVDDAVANKVCALFGRAEVRDYVDVDAIMASARYTGRSCSASPRTMIQALTGCCSLTLSPRLIACLMPSSGPTVRTLVMWMR